MCRSLGNRARGLLLAVPPKCGCRARCRHRSANVFIPGWVKRRRYRQRAARLRRSRKSVGDCALARGARRKRIESLQCGRRDGAPGAIAAAGRCECSKMSPRLLISQSSGTTSGNHQRARAIDGLRLRKGLCWCGPELSAGHTVSLETRLGSHGLPCLSSILHNRHSRTSDGPRSKPDAVSQQHRPVIVYPCRLAGCTPAIAPCGRVVRCCSHPAHASLAASVHPGNRQRPRIARGSRQ